MTADTGDRNHFFNISFSRVEDQQPIRRDDGEATVLPIHKRDGLIDRPEVRIRFQVWFTAFPGSLA